MIEIKLVITKEQKTVVIETEIPKTIVDADEAYVAGLVQGTIMNLAREKVRFVRIRPAQEATPES